MSDLSWIAQKSKLRPSMSVLYGPSGCGKTTLAVGCPMPMVMQTEDGLGILTKDRDIANSKGIIPDYDKFMEHLKSLLEVDHPYKTLVVDSLDHFEPLVEKKTCDVNGWKNVDAPGFGKGPAAALKYWREFLDLVNRLRNEKSMRIVFICHHKVKPFNDPTVVEPYDRYDLKLKNQYSSLILESCDMCLFLNNKKGTVKVQGNKGMTNQTVQTHKVLYTTDSPAAVAKNRFNLDPEIKVVEDRDDPIGAAEKTWAEIGKMIQGKKS